MIMEKQSLFLSVLLLNFLIQYAVGTKDVIPVENEVSGDQYVQIQHDPNNSNEKSFEKLFLPTREWKTIQPDEIIFPGLHYRLNMATGLKEAKLLEGNDGSEYYKLVYKWLQKHEGLMPEYESTLIEIMNDIMQQGTHTDNKPKEDSVALTVAEEGKLDETSLHSANTNGLKSQPEKHFQELADKKESRVLNDDSIKKIRQEHKKLVDDFRKTQHRASPQNVIEKERQFHESMGIADGELQRSKSNILRAMEELEDKSYLPPIDTSTRRQFKSYEQIKRELAELHVTVEDEQSKLSKLIKEYTGAKDDMIKTAVLEDLEYLLHAVDNAKVFLDNNGLSQVVSPALNSSDPSTRILGCRIVTACVQNFRHGQQVAMKAGVLPQLVRTLDDGEEKVSLAGVTALNSLLSHFSEAQQMFFTTSTNKLTKIFTGSHELQLKIKLMTVLADIIQEHQSPTRGALEQQLAFTEALNQIEWCDRLTDLLFLVQRKHFSLFSPNSHYPTYTGEDSLQRVLQALESSRDLCPLKLGKTEPVLSLLQTTFNELSREQDDEDRREHYRELFNNIGQVKDKIRQNEPSYNS